MFEEVTLTRGLSSHNETQHLEHMRNASAYMAQALWLARRGIDPQTPVDPYRTPKPGAGW
jgi:hypothetical protein